jgi:hypothetical protein
VIFDQAEYALRCEWGAHGVRQLRAISDVLIVVDVLSFSTAVDIAVSNGAVVFPYGNRDDRVEEYTRARSAQIAEKRCGRAALHHTLKYPGAVAELARIMKPEVRLVLCETWGGTDEVGASPAELVRRDGDRGAA